MYMCSSALTLHSRTARAHGDGDGAVVAGAGVGLLARLLVGHGHHIGRRGGGQCSAASAGKGQGGVNSGGIHASTAGHARRRGVRASWRFCFAAQAASGAGGRTHLTASAASTARVTARFILLSCSGCTCLHTWQGCGTEAAAGARRRRQWAQDPCPARPGTHRPCAPCLSGAAFQPEQASTCAGLRPATLGGTLSQRLGLQGAELRAVLLPKRPQRCCRAASVWRLPGCGSWALQRLRRVWHRSVGQAASSHRQQMRPKRVGRWRWGQRPQRASYRPLVAVPPAGCRDWQQHALVYSRGLQALNRKGQDGQSPAARQGRLKAATGILHGIL